MNPSEESQLIGQSIRVNDFDMYFQSAGQGQPLVLLHGFGGRGADWHQYIFNEPPAAYRMIMPDMRGHGRSTNPSRQFTFRQSSLDILALLDELKIDRFVAIGLSGGAKTLLHVATQQPDRVESMVLVSATPYFPKEARTLMAQVSIETRTEEDWNMMRERHAYGDDQIRLIWQLSNGFKDSYDDMNFTPPYLSTIKARTMIVHGDRDPFYPAHIALEMHQAIPRSYLWIVPNGGHGPIFGNMRNAFVNTSLAFLRGDWAGAS